MKLITKELLRLIPPLYSRENEANPMLVCKFFMPDGPLTWYVIEGSTREKDGCGFGVNCKHRPLTEYDPERDDILFYGYVTGLEPELGYFTLSGLETGLAPCDLPVERDCYFDPCRLSYLRAEG
jgi:hypothetical protein